MLSRPLRRKLSNRSDAFFGGGKETRTPDPYAASVMLYQLSYAPMATGLILPEPVPVILTTAKDARPTRA